MMNDNSAVKASLNGKSSTILTPVEKSAKVDIEKSLKQAQAQVIQLQIEKERAEKEALAEKQRNNAAENEKKQFEAFKMYMGTVKVTLPEVTTDDLLQENVGISTPKGLWAKLAIFVAMMAGYLIYYHWKFLNNDINDSELRIYNAALSHFVSHVWFASGTILFGFGIQYLLFNQQFRYFNTSDVTAHSFHSDFNNPSAEGMRRMGICLFTSAFPTYIMGQIFLLILG